jgi:glycosyltransferase involved in cell wall biosynthesis
MFLNTENRNGNGNGTGTETEAPDARAAVLERALANGKVEEGPREELPPPGLNGDGPREDGRPALAVFCYEGPDSPVGRFVANLAAALARRGTPVHLFVRRGPELAATGVSVHVLGESDGELLEQVQEFTHRACNAFLKLFPNGHYPLTLLGCEWSSVPALSLLRGIKDADMLLSLHSLERQRGDLGSDVSRRIEEIELCGIREARTVLVHEGGTAEVVKHWLPECADRLTCVRSIFPVAQFRGGLDAGAVKARVQVGPIDPLILYLGDLSEQYGPDLLMKALPGVLKNTKQARLVLVGDGPLYWPLRVYARYLLLEHAVRFAGHIAGQALHELIEAADMVVLPSREQTPWWPILAGWAARRPVVATHPAAPGLVEHEKDAVLVYPGEPSLVWGIERVLFDAGLRRSLAEHGEQKLDERLGWGSIAAQVAGLMSARQD